MYGINNQKFWDMLGIHELEMTRGRKTRISVSYQCNRTIKSK